MAEDSKQKNAAPHSPATAPHGATSAPQQTPSTEGAPTAPPTAQAPTAPPSDEPKGPQAKPARKGVMSNGLSITSNKIPDNAPQLVLPGSPSFDFDPETGEPNLNGETILAEAARHGVRVVVTSGGRKIYCCSISDYESAIGQLPAPRMLYEHFFPQAK